MKVADAEAKFAKTYYIKFKETAVNLFSPTKIEILSLKSLRLFTFDDEKKLEQIEVYSRNMTICFGFGLHMFANLSGLDNPQPQQVNQASPQFVCGSGSLDHFTYSSQCSVGAPSLSKTFNH